MCVGNIKHAVMGFDAKRDAARIGNCDDDFCGGIYTRNIASLRGGIYIPTQDGCIFRSDRCADRNAFQIRKVRIGCKLPRKSRILRGLPSLRIYRDRGKAEIGYENRERQANAKEAFLHFQPALCLSRFIHPVFNQIIHHAWV